MIVLHLESFKNNLVELDFSISKKKRVYMVKRSQEGEYFLHGNEIFFFSRLLLLSICQNTSEHVFEKNLT